MNPFQARAKQPASAFAGPYGHPFHPMLVPIPIGAWTALLFLDIASRNADDGAGYTDAGTVVLAVGLVGAVLAAIFGFLDYGQIQRGTKAARVATVHMAGNLLAIGLFGASFLARLGAAQDRVPMGLVVVTLVGLGILAFTGFLGGHLAYRYGVRVADEHTQAPAFDSTDGTVPPAARDAGRVDWLPGTNVPADEHAER
ncbi:MAG TPA: DUF2231 domain-containing protein [Frankiaceae bacterium]|nr:DUF2231 domain-containing protein [Frankiaceae bacterium]